MESRNVILEKRELSWLYKRSRRIIYREKSWEMRVFYTLLVFQTPKMKDYFSTLIGDVGHERSTELKLSITDPSLLKRSKVTDHERNIMKSLASEILHRRRILGEYVAVQKLELFLSVQSKTTKPILNGDPKLR